MPDQEHPGWQTSLDGMTQVIRDLIGELREGRAEQRRNLFRSVAGIVAAILVVGAALATISLGNRALSRTLTDCTQPAPDHACYVRSQRQTAKAIDEIVTRTVTAICVGFHPGHPQAVADCVSRALKGQP